MAVHAHYAINKTINVTNRLPNILINADDSKRWTPKYAGFSGELNCLVRRTYIEEDMRKQKPY